MFGLFLLLLLLAARPLQAYTDPGSGAMMVQILVAAFVGAGFYFRKFIRLIRPRDKD